MALKLTNNATSTLATAINASVTTISVQPVDAVKFPSLAAGDWFPLTIVDAAGNMEVMRVTARNGSVLTVQRAQEDTTAKPFTVGSRVDLRLTARTILEINRVQTVAGKDGNVLLEIPDIELLEAALNTMDTGINNNATNLTNTKSELSTEIGKRLLSNNPNFTGRGIGTQLSLRNGDSGANRNLLGFGFTGDADDTQKWILRSDGVLVLCKMNPATGAWERDLLQVFPNGDVRASATIGVGQSFMGGDGNVGGSVWSLTGSSDLFNYINKMTWGKTSVEIGFAVYANEDWGFRETVAPWTKCLAFCVSKTTQTQDERRRPRKIEGQHDWGWETWASMAGADEWGAEIAGSNTTGDRTMFSLAYTTMGRFRVSGGWGRTNERMAFLRVA